jgi:predicted pyridoxine 5'-phosphate oxidase superfamily flavin-nucleotide-binding protein
MQQLYGQQHHALQQQFDTENLAQAVAEHIVVTELAPEHIGFIESRDMFFLTTIDHRGYPTCSHKGGHVGFVKSPDNKTLIFPSYDGNGMFLSMGNISLNAKIGMLFIDFETPHRVRAHGDATVESVAADSPYLKDFPGAELIVKVTISEAFVNCPRYIHRYQRLQSSPYVPQQACAAPFAQWKRIDTLQDALPPRDQHKADTVGGTITTEQYVELLMQGKA